MRLFFLGGHTVLVNGGFKSEVQLLVQSEVGTSLISTWLDTSTLNSEIVNCE